MKNKLSLILLTLFILAGIVFVTVYLIKDSADNVVVEMDREELINFDVTGNVVKDGSTWFVVYEEPGAPALKEKLMFDKESICVDKGSCRPVYWLAGDRVEVVGVKGDGGVLVHSFKVVDDNKGGEENQDNEKETGVDMSNENCEERGGIVMYPDCVGCDPYCSFDNGKEFEEIIRDDNEEGSLCVDNCGNGRCEEIVCMGEGCPCSETKESCPEDCV